MHVISGVLQYLVTSYFDNLEYLQVILQQFQLPVIRVLADCLLKVFILSAITLYFNGPPTDILQVTLQACQLILLTLT